MPYIMFIIIIIHLRMTELLFNIVCTTAAITKTGSYKYLKNRIIFVNCIIVNNNLSKTNYVSLGLLRNLVGGRS